MLWSRIEKELIDVDVLAGRILEETAARRFPAAQKLLITELPTAIDEEADAIIAAIQLNAERVRQVAEEIEGERKSRLLWIFGLDGVSVALAIALAVLALRTVASKEAVMRRRSEELEGFAGRVAHDLLNPIAAVEMALAAAERSDSARRDSAFARGRGSSLHRARRLIDDLLGFAQAGARPQAGAVALVAEVVEGVVEELRLPALERGITIDVDVPQRSLAVRCANGVLASLVSNLVRNAIKHMGDRPRREVWVRVQVHGARARFEVGDTGPGLPPGLVARAFDPYIRGAGSAEPGLGLGLATVSRLVEGHDGRYGVRSELGAGALFWFELPLAPSPHRARERHPSLDGGTRPARPAQTVAADDSALTAAGAGRSVPQEERVRELLVLDPEGGEARVLGGFQHTQPGGRARVGGADHDRLHRAVVGDDIGELEPPGHVKLLVAGEDLGPDVRHRLADRDLAELRREILRGHHLRDARVGAAGGIRRPPAGRSALPVDGGLDMSTCPVQRL